MFLVRKIFIREESVGMGSIERHVIESLLELSLNWKLYDHLDCLNFEFLKF